jgi:hypothetical protein
MSIRRAKNKNKVLPRKALATSVGEERLFILLHALLGYSAADSFLIAYDTKASKASASTMASKILTDKRVQAEIYRLYDLHAGGLLAFNENALKSIL